MLDLRYDFSIVQPFHYTVKDLGGIEKIVS